jgi:hypothetical protein
MTNAPTKKPTPKQASPAKKAAAVTSKSTPAPTKAAAPADDWFDGPLPPAKAVLSNRPQIPEQSNQHGRYLVEKPASASTAKPANTSTGHPAAAKSSAKPSTGTHKAQPPSTNRSGGRNV